MASEEEDLTLPSARQPPCLCWSLGCDGSLRSFVTACTSRELSSEPVSEPVGDGRGVPYGRLRAVGVASVTITAQDRPQGRLEPVHAISASAGGRADAEPPD